MNRDEAYGAVEALADWSDWFDFTPELVAVTPQAPGVYLFRLSGTHEVVYVGMAGERIGGGQPQGLRGRLRIYSRGRGAVSGFGEATFDYALGDPEWVEKQLLALRTTGPKRAKVWAHEAIAHLAPEVQWAECSTKAEALALEKQVEELLGMHGLWNRVSRKARAALAAAENTAPPATSPQPTQPSTSRVPGTTFSVSGHQIDLEVLYTEMLNYSTVSDDGERVFDGHAKNTPAMKRLLNQLFGVPVTDRMHPVNNAVRSECRDRLAALGWATKGPGRSAKYTLHRVG